MKNRFRWLTILIAFVLTSLLPAIVLETSAAGPYEYLILDQSEAGALNLDTVQIIDNSAGDNIDVQGEYTGACISEQPNQHIITFNVTVSRLSPNADISFDTALANCALCANPGWGNCRIWGVGFEKPCYTRFEDGYRDFGAYTIDRNFCRLGGTSVFSVNGLKVVITTEKLDYGLTQEVWGETKTRHDEFANMIAHKIRTTYDPQTITLTLTPLNGTYAPGETTVISGNVADTFDSTPLDGATITIDVDGTSLNSIANASGDFSVQFDIPADVSSIGTYPITVTASSTGYPDVTLQTYITVAKVILEITVRTDKDTYVPGETAIIQGQVTKGGNSAPGITVAINISGTRLSTVTDGSGKYQVNFLIPGDSVLSSYNVTVTATGSALDPATAITTFVIGQEMTVTITPDKDSYSIGDTVYCNIIVEDASGNPVPYADLTISSIRLVSGRKNSLTGITDALGENLWSFVWGQDAAGKTIAEGKLKVEVSATKDGFNIAIAELLISGCGDLIVDENEFCLDCPEDCPCGPNEICDPSSDYKNSNNMCSPKVACIFISKGLGWYHEWYASDDIKGIRKKYQKKGYSVTPDIYVNDIYDVTKYLTRPSTKAIAYAGHSVDIPTIENVTSSNIPSAFIYSNNKAGSFVFRCRYEVYAARWFDLQNKIMAIANDKKDQPNLDCAFMFTCYSLANDSLLNYLLRDGGTYWGYPITLPGNASLIERFK